MSTPPALITTFTPAQSCLSYQYATSKTINYATDGSIPSYGPNLVINLGPPISYAPCFPSGWATDSMSYFSPGICPSGYTSACSTLSSLPPINSGETTVMCCPSGYTCGTYLYPWRCTSSYIGYAQTVLDLYTADSKSGSYTAEFGGVNAFSVQIRFRATDFVSTVTKSATNMPTTSVSTISNSHNTGNVTEKKLPSLSTGARVGVGVGVAIAILILLLVAVLLYRRQGRRPKKDQNSVTNKMPYGMDTKQELDGIFQVAPKTVEFSPSIAELDAPESHQDFTSSQSRTSNLKAVISGDSASKVAELDTQADISSVESCPLVVGHAPSKNMVKPPMLTASREIDSSIDHPQELADTAPEARSTVSAPDATKLGCVEEKHEIQQQLKRIVEERTRLNRINELERMEVELQERLAGLTNITQ